MSWTAAIKKTERAWISQVRQHCGRGPQSRVPVLVVEGFEAPHFCLFPDDPTLRIMVGKSWRRRSVGELCRIVFAATYSDISVSFENHGYVPTMRPHTGRDMFTKWHNAIVAELADHLELLGHKIWRGSRR